MEKKTLEEIAERLAVENFVIEFSTPEGDFELYAGRIYSAVPEFYDGKNTFYAKVIYPDARLIKRGDFDQPTVLELVMKHDKQYVLTFGGENPFVIRGQLKDLNPAYGLEKTITLERDGFEYEGILRLFDEN